MQKWSWNGDDLCFSTHVILATEFDLLHQLAFYNQSKLLNPAQAGGLTMDKCTDKIIWDLHIKSCWLTLQHPFSDQKKWTLAVICVFESNTDLVLGRWKTI